MRQDKMPKVVTYGSTNTEIQTNWKEKEIKKEY
jgi:hypothetical protein